MKTYSIALIPGDGIGVRRDRSGLDGFGRRQPKAADFTLHGTRFPWSCAYYKETGAMMPPDGIETLQRVSMRSYLGAVGWPAEVPDAVSLHGLLLPIRKAFVNTPTFGRTGCCRASPAAWARSFDIVCMRENTEGEYSGAGGRVHPGTRDEVAVETAIFTRKGVERILRFGFEQARARRGKLASVTKSNAQKYSMVFWDEVTRGRRARLPRRRGIAATTSTPWRLAW